MTANVVDTVAAEQFDSGRFRAVLGHFCTGVAVVTGLDGEVPLGFACQSFAALSLDPPLVLFCPAKSSRTWPVLEQSGRFAVNVLAAQQQEVSSVFGSRGADKFDSIGWRSAPSGAPVLDGALTWIDCTVQAVHDAGDHYVVIGKVTALGDTTNERPLLFYRGAYTATEPDNTPSQRDTAPEDLAALLTWPRPDDWF